MVDGLLLRWVVETDSVPFWEITLGGLDANMHPLCHLVHVLLQGHDSAVAISEHGVAETLQLSTDLV